MNFGIDTFIPRCMKKDRIKESKEDAEFTVTQLNTVPYIPGDIESLLKKKGLICDPKEFLEYLEKEG